MPGCAGHAGGASGHDTGDLADLIVELIPPQYTGRTRSRLVNPTSLDVLGGTEAIVRAPGGGAARIRVNGTDLSVGGEGSARVVLTDSGYVHADMRLRRTVGVPGRVPWPVLSAWRHPAVAGEDPLAPALVGHEVALH